MKYFIFLFFFSSFLKMGFSQTRFNIACKNFTYDGHSFDEGKNLKTIFEVIISKSNYPFKLIEREKMDKFFESLHEEKNLYKDLSNEFNKKLQLAGVEYLVYGDMTKNIETDKYRLIIEFIKITGDNVTVKLPMLITLDKKQISDNEILKIIFDKEIEVFVNSYFLNKQENNNERIIPNYFKELEKRDSIINSHEMLIREKSKQIKNLDSTFNILQSDTKLKNQTINTLSNSILELQKENSAKDFKIERLSNDVSDIKVYANMARLDVFGLEFHFGYGLKGGDTELSLLMKNVLEEANNTVNIKLTDSTLINLDRVIEKFPSFPFGYSFKAKYLFTKNDRSGIIYLIKAILILEITTSIVGHNGQHDQELKNLKDICLKLGLILPKN